jgi:dipeptidase E
MKFLLTSAGIKNASISNALVGLLGKPVAESTALVIPTGVYPMAGPVEAWQMISGQGRTPLCEVGWKSLGVLELTALPSLGEERWVPAVREADALLVCGGDVLYLSHWMRRSGLADLLPSLQSVYVGVSAGSMVLAPHVGEEFIDWRPPADSDEALGKDRALGIVDFAMFPHLDLPKFPENSMDRAVQWAARLPVPGYAIDDQTAIKITEGTVEVVSEGHWKLLAPPEPSPSGQ